MGNGDLGVVLSGGAGNSLSYWLGLNQFWAIEEYEYPRKGEPPLPRPLPVAQVIVSASNASLTFTRFSAEQDVDEAEVRTLALTADNSSWLTTRSFVAANNNTLVTSLSWFSTRLPAGKDLLLNVTTRTYPGLNGAPTGAGCTATLGHGTADCGSGQSPWGQWVKRQAFPAFGPYTVEAAVGTRVLEANTVGTSTDQTVWSSATVSVGVNSTTYLVTTVLTNRDELVFFQDPLPVVQQLLGAMQSTDSLANEHRVWWQNYWASPGLWLPGDELTELYWYGSQYALACASRQGKVSVVIVLVRLLVKPVHQKNH